MASAPPSPSPPHSPPAIPLGDAVFDPANIQDFNPGNVPDPDGAKIGPLEPENPEAPEWDAPEPEKQPEVVPDSDDVEAAATDSGPVTVAAADHPFDSNGDFNGAADNGNEKSNPDDGGNGDPDNSSNGSPESVDDDGK